VDVPLPLPPSAVALLWTCRCRAAMCTAGCISLLRSLSRPPSDPPPSLDVTRGRLHQFAEELEQADIGTPAHDAAHLRGRVALRRIRQPGMSSPRTPRADGPIDVVDPSDLAVTYRFPGLSTPAKQPVVPSGGADAPKQHADTPTGAAASFRV
jgi:hypothetical protein